MDIKVINPGLQTTVQDSGRKLSGHLGVSSCGAADNYSFKLANLIVGNTPTKAALEMTIVGGVYQFDEDADICLSGSDFSAKINNKALSFNKKIHIKKKSVLEIGKTKDGARCYLAIRGGIDMKHFLGSASTHLTTKTGGLDGRSLKKGDLLKIGKSKLNPNNIISLDSKYSTKRSVLRITEGLQKDWFSDLNWNTLLNSLFKVSKKYSRMGIKLEGPSIAPANKKEMITEGIALGAVQIPRNGKPIISFVDHQTTGGYPVIANVISVDICKVGQLKEGDSFQFDLVDLDAAEKMRIKQSKSYE
ncbi:MAG: hypothetical protein CMG04_09945 [Candidatus Marinimicrobia bacterium]|nr:hypothetical protein [Candidatus Neomarinimicrobiota bacterium]|tara:strand:- start:1620 stop:2531 length:912 start_codon:yes stop_codon:yes gene_type:complete